MSDEPIKVVKKKFVQPSFNDFFTTEDSGAYIPKDRTEKWRPLTIEEAKHKAEDDKRKAVYEQFKTFEDLEKYVASQYGRRHIGWPCDIAQDLSLDDRQFHIKTCPECKRLIDEFEKKIHYSPSEDVEEK
jgi:hypothetical protein